jgi:DNA-binding transcriptional LysR family regulator
LQSRLADTASGVQLHTRQTEQRGGVTIEQRLRAGEFDLAWMVVFDDAPGIIAQRLYAERLICATRPGHPSLGPDGQFTLERYAEARHALISPRGQPGGFVDDALHAAGLKRKVAWMTSSFLAAPLVVSTSDIILTLPERLARTLVASGVLLHLCPVPVPLPTFQVSIVYHERFKRDVAHRWLREQTVLALAQERR